MPDTGAPWNIPYVEAADLVSDWPADSLALANAIDAGLDAANVGIGSNVVQTVLSDVYSESLATGISSTVVPTLTATITPSSDTSKILILVSLVASTAGVDGMAGYVFRRGATAIGQGNTASNRSRVTQYGGARGNDTNDTVQLTGIFLDSPATASSVTYGISLQQTATSTQTIYLNRSPTDSDVDDIGRSISTITVIEVAA